VASADAAGVFRLPFNQPANWCVDHVCQDGPNLGKPCVNASQCGNSPPYAVIFNIIGASYANSATQFQPLEITIVPCLDSHEPCADADGDGLRDDSCAWWTCDAATCVSTAIPFADIGGANGACPPDLTVDANDRFHALNCFSNIDTMGNALAYPCEASPPGATNVDAGGAFGACCPDGVCDGHDAFHTLHAFVGDSPCQCPANFVCPCPVPTMGNCIGDKLQSCSSSADCGGGPCNLALCPPGPGPAAPEEEWPRVAERTAIKLVPRRHIVAPGGVVEVDVFLMEALADLRGYQLHTTTAGGKRGRLELIDLAIDDRPDHALAGLNNWRAFNASTGQMLAGLDTPGVGVAAGAYLATLTFRASLDAAGHFSVDLLHDDTDLLQRTFLFPTPPGAKIDVAFVEAAVIAVEPRKRTARR
jgi:hypothetical protein